MSNKKLEILNSMEIEEYEADGATLYYALVKNTHENRLKLFNIGVNLNEVWEMVSDDIEHIDISGLGFRYGGAKWFDGEKWLAHEPNKGAWKNGQQ